MTENEASFVLANIDRRVCDDELSDALDMAIKVLKQQPCDDVISREAVEEMIKAEMPERGMWEIEGDKEKETVCEVCVDLMQKLSELPSVTPKAKMGRWITWKEAGNEIPSETRFECSVCHDTAQTLCNGLDLLSSFCPNCGARMEAETKIEQGLNYSDQDTMMPAT